MKNETTLIFTGDIGFDKYMDKKWEDSELLAPAVKEYLLDTDHLIINVEGPLSEQKKVTLSNGMTSLLHTMDPAATSFFQEINADIWNICNNHIMDAGSDGMADTLGEAAKCGVKTLGAGMNLAEAARPVILPEAGGIGLIGVGYQRACRKAGEDTAGCLSWSDMETIQQSIDEVKKTCRWCIIVAHGGEEFTALPSPYTRDRYMEYLNMGADLVVGHHPHVPMNYETFGVDESDGKVTSVDEQKKNAVSKAIFYSLGNFIFDTDYQRSQYNTEFGLFLKLAFTEEAFSYEPYGIKIDRSCDHVIPWELPKIFVDVQEEEYQKLAPLAARMLIENTKRQLRFLKPDQFKNATEEDFYNNFYEPLRSGRVPGEVLDFQLVYPLSLQAEKGEWKFSKLEGVKAFILEQIDAELL